MSSVLSDRLPYWAYCPECKNPHNEGVSQWNKLRFQNSYCLDCLPLINKKRFGCCGEAIQMYCSCHIAFTCSKHGQTHIGSHD